MTERSKAWKEKRSQLDVQEERLKNELDDVSTSVESSVKTALKISLITGGIFLAGYGLYKILSSPDEKASKPESEKQEPKKRNVQEVKVKSGFSLKNLLLERLAVVAVSFIGNQVNAMLSSKANKEDDDNEATEN